MRPAMCSPPVQCAGRAGPEGRSAGPGGLRRISCSWRTPAEAPGDSFERAPDRDATIGDRVAVKGHLVSAVPRSPRSAAAALCSPRRSPSSPPALTPPRSRWPSPVPISAGLRLTQPCRSHVLATSHDCVQPEGADHETGTADDRKDHPENHPLGSRCHAASLRRWTATGCRAASAQCGIGDAKRNWSVDGCPTGQAGQHSSTLAVTDLSITAALCGAPRPYGVCGTASGKAP